LAHILAFGKIETSLIVFLVEHAFKNFDIRTRFD
jgi:hypothetical protein